MAAEEGEDVAAEKGEEVAPEDPLAEGDGQAQQHGSSECAPVPIKLLNDIKEVGIHLGNNSGCLVH